MTRLLSTKKLLVLLAAVTAFVAGTTALAQEIPNAKIIVVDTRLISTNSAVAQDMNRQVNQINTDLAAEIQAQEAELLAEQQELQQQQALLPPEVYNQRDQEFRLKVSQHQQNLQQKQLRLERAFMDANDEVQRALKPILQNVLQQTGATMMIEKSNVMEQIPGLDVTTRVIEQLDLALPTLEIELPPEPAATPAAEAPATQ